MGKRTDAPLSIAITMAPSSKWAERAVSIKMFMPLLDDKRLMVLCKLLRVRQLSHFQSDRFAQLDDRINIEDGLASSISNMNV